MTHDEIQELLPWYSTLEDARRRELDTHVAKCVDCANELIEIQQMQGRMTANVETPEPSPFLLQRTLSKIEAYESQKQAPSHKGRGWLRWRQWLDWWQISPIPVRSLVVAQGVFVLALAAGLLYFRQQTQNFTTLSGPAASSTGLRLTISFQPGTAEQTFRETISAVKGNIVNGPSALGLYIIEIPGNSNVDRTLAELRANPNVQFAQKNRE